MMHASGSKSRSPPQTLNLTGGLNDQPDIINSSELVREALRESMISFQETLDQYKEDSPGPNNISSLDLITSHSGVTSTPNEKSGKFSTFPRLSGSPMDEESPGLMKLSRQLSNSSISSISTSSSAIPYNTSPLTPEAYLASLPSAITPGVVYIVYVYIFKIFPWLKLMIYNCE